MKRGSPSPASLRSVTSSRCAGRGVFRSGKCPRSGAQEWCPQEWCQSFLGIQGLDTPGVVPEFPWNPRSRPAPQEWCQRFLGIQGLDTRPQEWCPGVVPRSGAPGVVPQEWCQRLLRIQGLETRNFAGARSGAQEWCQSFFGIQGLDTRAPGVVPQEWCQSLLRIQGLETRNFAGAPGVVPEFSENPRSGHTQLCGSLGR
jgi:hypothetical protein